MKTRKYNSLTILVAFLLGLSGFSCRDYLDVVPDNIPTVDHAFNKRLEAENFLYGLYSFLPNFSDPTINPAFLAGDEAWLNDNLAGINLRIWQIAKGEQGTDAPVANYWASKQAGSNLKGGKPIFTAIRDCNIFLENIHKPADLSDLERELWIAEVKFLKAYYHFWLLRMYGPIPIIDKNLPISASSEAQIYREPIDKVVEYIVNLLDEASKNLPLTIEDISSYLGRVTQPIALAVKAQVLVHAASPLFNGNTDYADFVDNRGINLFPQTYETSKWGKAIEALNEAIEVSHEAGHELYDFKSSGVTTQMNDKTILAMQVRGAVTERWNNEIIWGDARNSNLIQTFAHPVFTAEQQGTTHLHRSYAPTLRVVEQFYTENGVPIDEDKNWVNTDLYEIREGDKEHEFYIREGFETINLHFNREARFYGAISFDGGTFFGMGNISDKNLPITNFKFASVGWLRFERHSTTGYLVKKVIPWRTSIQPTSGTPNYFRYAFPIIRLADLYLMYAEALNEYKETPDADIYEFIDLVRNRTGLNGVVESWVNHSIQPDKPLSKEGMRNIIRLERMNELAFEGSRFWDLRRWKLSEYYMNRPIRGLSIFELDNKFYKVREIYNPNFELKDYLWPIRQSDLLRNQNCVQNPNW